MRIFGMEKKDTGRLLRPGKRAMILPGAGFNPFLLESPSWY